MHNIDMIILVSQMLVKACISINKLDKKYTSVKVDIR